MQDAALHGAEVPSREVILDAAAALMARLGYAGTSISKISAASGSPASSIYWHFGNKDGIYLAVLRRARDNLVASLPGTPVGDTVGERLTAFLDGAGAAFERHPHDLRLLLDLGMLEQRAGAAAIAELGQYRLALRQWATDSLGHVFGLADRPGVAGELARFMLSVVGGTAIARWFDGPVTSLPVQQLRVALVALARHHGLPVDEDPR
ncbi:TetR/AcrR family transcriptional regulator [Micromonospora phytophila]|uniref:TetR/AcrR family transcriptional regulator n=1 Tax=Micromonospora phytophila TaxID=709888 RepID=UPI002030376B|nr:TetR/AcrR family transcriptional regulator [Micromonospora phytophila]MCM0673163.1 TetR/AcrR family transcriptional regulator [Micromonospora phytophila]